MPELRKEKLYLESEINTSFQKFMFDHIYHQQEIYNYCSKEILNDDLPYIKMKYPNLPFAGMLVNIKKFSSLMQSTIFSDSLKAIDKMSFEDIDDLAVCSEVSIILRIIKAIHLTVKHFCQATAYLISSVKTENTQLILNEYLKRYKSFIDFAISFHQTYQNLSIIVNVLMNTFKCTHICDKFSVINMLVSF